MAKVKLGPMWDRAVFNDRARKLKYRLRAIRFEAIEKLRLVEYINPFEEVQLLNLHPEVEKERRNAELWVDTKDGRSVRVATAEQGGLLLVKAADAARLAAVPLASERRQIESKAA